jgi:hypothetical protein
MRHTSEIKVLASGVSHNECLMKSTSICIEKGQSFCFAIVRNPNDPFVNCMRLAVHDDVSSLVFVWKILPMSHFFDEGG